MNPITVVMICFSMIGAIDRIIGGKMGLAKDFERGFTLFGTMALSMIGFRVDFSMSVYMAASASRKIMVLSPTNAWSWLST